MYKNYFVLNRIICELNPILEEFRITEIFSQEKNKLIIKCVKNSEKFIEISVDPGEPYFTLKDEYHRARKNSINFFEDHLPLRINVMEISDRDRLVRINCERFNIYFAVRGKFTNIFLEDADGRISSFKNEDKSYLEEFKNELKSHNFITVKNKIKLYPVDTEFDEYKKKYPVIGKEIVTEAGFRFSETTDWNRAELLSGIIAELLEGVPAVFSSGASNEIFLSVDSFHIFPSDQIKRFETMYEALNYYIGKKSYLDNFIKKRKTIGTFIDRAMLKLSAKMNDLQGRIERGSREEEYNKIGNLLLINLNKLPRNTKFVELEDIYHDNSLIKIKLDPLLTSQKNADRYFDKARGEKTAYRKSKDLFKNISGNYKKLLQTKERFEKADSTEELITIMKELKIKSEEKKGAADDIASRFKHYIIEKKYDVFVGKDSANNDLLTMKFARQNDYWFHARSVPGSHVILKVPNTKEPMPKNIIKSAASIAAYHSKAKTSGLAPVSYTLKKYVIKKKGMEPGKVALLKEDVLLVKPVVPSNCEYISAE